MFQYAGASRFAYNWALAREIENYEKGGKFLLDAELRKEFTKLRHSDEYAWLLSISKSKMPVLRIRTFLRVCRNSQDSSQKREQCRSSIRTTLRYASVIHTLNLKAFLPAGRQINRK